MWSGCVEICECEYFFFCKQKTAYEMRISDWSSDVCSSDLRIPIQERALPTDEQIVERIRERLSVKVEQEIRHIPTREREWQVDRLVGLVRSEARRGREGWGRTCRSPVSPDP